MNLYFIIDDATAQEWNGRKSKYAPDTFAAEKLKDGAWACGHNTISSFPEAFENKSFSVRNVEQGEWWEKDVEGKYIEVSAQELLLNKAKTLMGLSLAKSVAPDEKPIDAVVEESIDVKKEVNEQLDKNVFYYTEEPYDALWAWVIGAVIVGYFVVVVSLKSCN